VQTETVRPHRGALVNSASLIIAKAATSCEAAAAFGVNARIGLGGHVDGRFEKRLAIVVIENAAGDFFELVVADDFRILRNDLVVHGVYGVGGWFLD
jgi:hypothetical protein